MAIVKASFLNLGQILLHDYTPNIHVDVMHWSFFLKRNRHGAVLAETTYPARIGRGDVDYQPPPAIGLHEIIDVPAIQTPPCASSLWCKYRCRQDDPHFWPRTRLCNKKQPRLLSQASQHGAPSGCR